MNRSRSSGPRPPKGILIRRPQSGGPLPRSRKRVTFADDVARGNRQQQTQPQPQQQRNPAQLHQQQQQPTQSQKNTTPQPLPQPQPQPQGQPHQTRSPGPQKSGRGRGILGSADGTLICVCALVGVLVSFAAIG